MKKVKPITPDFSKVVLEEAIFIESNIKNPSKIFNKELIESFKTQFSLKPTYNIKQKLLKVDIKLYCSALDENDQPIGIEGNFHLEFKFRIEDFENYLVKSLKTERDIPSKELIVPLAGTAYSTARGMIIMKVLGTPLEGFSLPIVLARDLFPSDHKQKDVTETTTDTPSVEKE